jgi:phosphoglycerate dehydrogenase-like enzyme
MSGFQMRMLTADPFMRSNEGEFGVQLVSLERLLRESDLISIHVGLTAETRSMLGEEQFKLMKASAILVNTSRGAVMDEEALIKAIEENRIAGAALDVTAQEPLPLLSPLRKFNNVVLTPHSAASSKDSIEQWHHSVADSIAAVLNGYWPPFPANPEVTPRISLRPYASFAGVRMSKM